MIAPVSFCRTDSAGSAASQAGAKENKAGAAMLRPAGTPAAFWDRYPITQCATIGELMVHSQNSEYPAVR